MPMRKRATTRSTTIDSTYASINDDAHRAERNLSGGNRNKLVYCVKFLLLTILLSLLCLLLLMVSGIEPVPRLLGSFHATPEKSFATVTKRNFSQCASHEHKDKAPKPKPELADGVEPLWLPAYPTSLPGRNGAIY